MTASNIHAADVCRLLAVAADDDVHDHVEMLRIMHESPQEPVRAAALGKWQHRLGWQDIKVTKVPTLEYRTLRRSRLRRIARQTVSGPYAAARRHKLAVSQSLDRYGILHDTCDRASGRVRTSLMGTGRPLADSQVAGKRIVRG